MTPSCWPRSTLVAGAHAADGYVHEGDPVAVAGVDEDAAAAAVGPLHRAGDGGGDRLPGRVAIGSGPVERVVVLGEAAPVLVGAVVVALHDLPFAAGERPDDAGALPAGRRRLIRCDDGSGLGCQTGGGVGGFPRVGGDPLCQQLDGDPARDAIAGDRHEPVLRRAVERDGRAGGEDEEDLAVGARSGAEIGLGRRHCTPCRGSGKDGICYNRLRHDASAMLRQEHPPPVLPREAPLPARRSRVTYPAGT